MVNNFIKNTYIILGVNMRYYIYLDREFLKSLFSVVDDEFNIDIIEYSLRKSVTTNNSLCVEPCVEKGCQNEDSDKKEYKNNKSKFIKADNFNKEKLGVSYDKSNICNTETQIRYINIDDVSDIKNTNFYHKLCEKIRERVKEKDSRIIEDSGSIRIYKNKDTLKIGNNDVFMINENFVLIENNKLQADLNILGQIECEVKVIGYMMNCKNSSNNKVLKAIAIFIE